MDSAGYSVGVLEVKCARSQEVLERLNARCTHGVPISVMARMQERWETDHLSRIVALRPAGVGLGDEGLGEGDGQVAGGAVGDRPGVGPMIPLQQLPSLHQWLSTHHCVHYSKRRRRTHLLMEVCVCVCVYV